MFNSILRAGILGTYAAGMSWTQTISGTAAVNAFPQNPRVLILLARFSDAPAVPHDKQWFQDLFLTRGGGGAVDFWYDVSHGALDLSTTSTLTDWKDMDLKLTTFRNCQTTYATDAVKLHTICRPMLVRTRWITTSRCLPVSSKPVTKQPETKSNPRRLPCRNPLPGGKEDAKRQGRGRVKRKVVRRLSILEMICSYTYTR